MSVEQVALTIYLGIVIAFIVYVTVIIIRAFRDAKKDSKQNNDLNSLLKTTGKKNTFTKAPKKSVTKAESEQSRIETEQKELLSTKKRRTQLEKNDENQTKTKSAHSKKQSYQKVADNKLASDAVSKDITSKYRKYYLNNNTEARIIIVTQSTVKHIQYNIMHGNFSEHIAYKPEVVYADKINPSAGIISERSPIGKELLHKSIGDRVIIGKIEYKITKIDDHWAVDQ